VACPVCFPKIAIIGSLLGLNYLADYEVYFFYAFHAFIVFIFYKQCRYFLVSKNKYIMSLSTVSTLLFFVSLYIVVNEWLSYIALAGIVAATIWSSQDKASCQQCAAE
jgi:hypothetical protein